MGPVFPLELKSTIPGEVFKLLSNTIDNIWDELADQSSDSFTKIAINITSTISKDESPVTNLRSLYSLSLWFDLIKSSFCNSFIKILPFLSKYITNHILSTLNAIHTKPGTDNEDLCKALLMLLNQSLHLYLEKDPSSVQPMLRNINYALVNYVSNSTWRTETKCIATEILGFLIQDNGTRFVFGIR